MSKKFGIPKEVELKIRRRDRDCVYCRKVMIYPCVGDSRRDWATIEHLREEGPFYWNEGLKEEDLAICCGSCNSSRGRKKLLDWFQKAYCTDTKREINEKTVAELVREYISKNER